MSENRSRDFLTVYSRIPFLTHTWYRRCIVLAFR